MSKEGSVAPKERVNITYKPATGDAQQQVELPLKILMLGEFTGRADERPVEERTPISIDKDTFNQVMAEQKLAVETSVPNRLTEEPGAELTVKLQVRSLSDFTPDGIAAQVPELVKLLELLAGVDRPLSELVGELPHPTLVHKQVQCPWALKGTVMRILNERFSDANVDLLDGIKVFDERGWVQVLPDPDEPLIHIYAEGETEEASAELEAELRGIVTDAISREEIAAHS